MLAVSLGPTLRTGGRLRLDRLGLNVIGLAADQIGISPRRAPPASWLDTISIGRSPFYFSCINPLCSMIAVSWESQLKTVGFSGSIFNVSSTYVEPRQSAFKSRTR